MKPTFGMFGIYRWFLAAMVVLQHLGPPRHYTGGRAVYAFFMLSGYVVTYILDTHYLQIKNGIAKFYINRALRIYPAYWTVMILSIPLTLYAPETASHLHIVMPVNGGEWIKNISIFGLTKMDGSHPFTLVSVGWSLAVEMTWWLLFPFIIQAAYLRTLFALTGLGYQVLVGGDSSGGPFFPIVVMAPFSLGMLLYFRKKNRYADIVNAGGRMGCLLIVIFFFNLNVFFTLLMNAVIVYYLSGLKTSRVPRWLERVDNFLGNLAYPIFLLHLVCAGTAKVLLPSLDYFSWKFFLAGFISSNILAVILFYSTEYPVNVLRRRIKYRQDWNVRRDGTGSV